MTETVAARDLGTYIEQLMETTYPAKAHFFLKYPLLAPILFAAVVAAIQGIVTSILGGFSGTEDVLDLTEDASYGLTLVIICVGIYYYFLLPRLLRRAFVKLYENHIFKSEEIESTAAIQKLFASKMVHRGPLILSVAGGLAFYSWFTLFVPYQPPGWMGHHPITLIVTALLWAFAYFWLGGLFVNVILATRLISALFNYNDIVVHPMHPDRCGGFNPLGQYSLNLSYLALSMGALLVVYAIGATIEERLAQDYLLHIMIVLYVFVVPTLFYLPLHSAHRAMILYRDHLIRHTSDHYRHEQESTLDFAENLSAVQLEEKVKILDSLKKIEAHQRTYPVWPFNMRIRLTVLAHTLVPVVPTVIGLAQDWLR